jgi:hypothetical protein
MNSTLDLNGGIYRIVSQNAFTTLELQQLGEGQIAAFLDAEGNRIGYLNSQALMMPRVVTNFLEFPADILTKLYVVTETGELRLQKGEMSFHIELSDPQP